MTIRNYLLLLVASALFMLSMLTGFSIWSKDQIIQNIKEINTINKIKVSYNFDTLLQEMHLQFVLSLQHNTENATISKMHDHTINKHTDKIDQALAKLKDAIASVKNHPLKASFTVHAQNSLVNTENYLSIYVPALESVKSGQFESATKIMITKLNVSLFSTLEANKNFRDILNNEMAEAEKDSRNFSDWVDQIQIILTVLSLSLITLIAWLVFRFVMGSINKTVSEVDNIVKQMRLTNRLTEPSHELGKLSAGFNEMLNQTELMFSDVKQAMLGLSNGHFEYRIQSNQVGDLAEIKDQINTSLTQIDSVMKTIDSAMASLRRGQFATKFDTNAPGTYGVILTSTSKIMFDLHEVIADIHEVMTAVHQGDFSRSIDAQARGELQEVGEVINKTIKMLDQITNDLLAIAEAQMRGELAIQFSREYEGRFKVLQQMRTASSQKLSDVFVSAMSVTNVVSSSSHIVTNGAQNLSMRIREQAAKLEETSATMNEMSAAVQTNTQNAKKVSELAHQVQVQTGAGVEVMEQTITAMQSIKQSSSKIADIVTLIDGIAFQTNLLALNAAVEAARAGEHGRGFAVVAGEVRALAQKSANAAKEIKELINDSVNRIDVGTQLADKSGEMLSGITDAISQVANMIEEIASASAEQAAGIGHVHNAIADIDRVTQENSALVAETTTAAESLNEEAIHLKNSMSFFKTNQATTHNHQHKLITSSR